MTTHHTAQPQTSRPGNEAPQLLEDHDLTPEGLAGNPASQEDFESIVHTGNS